MKKLKGSLYAPNETVTNYKEDSFETLEPGVYECKIVQVEDEPDREYLYLEYDITEGRHAGYYERLSERAGFWGGRIFLSYKRTAENIFKRALKAINISNEGYLFNPFDDGKNADEKTLIGRKFWIVLHEEEYDKNDGTVGTRIVAEATAFLNETQAKEGKFNKRLLEKTSRRRTEESSLSTPDFMPSSGINPFA